MKIFKIIRLSDEKVMFIQKHESIESVGIPSNWELHLEHTILDEEENEIIVPATCRIEEEEILPPSYSELRKEQYKLRIDPFIAEAITDLSSGEDAAMEALLAEKALIKLQFPKPE